MTRILADTNTAPQKVRIFEENTQDSANAGILDAEQLELSKLVNARFYCAEIQVPNTYVKKTDVNGNETTEAVWDHNDPKFADFDMVETTQTNPDSGMNTVTHQFVTSFHITRWPERWRAYKDGRQLGAEGIAIEKLTSIPASAHNLLKEAGIFTIEQLAKAPNAGSLVLQGNAFQSAARKYLEGSASTKTAELEDQVAELKEQIAELLAATKAKAAK